jgi:hypothetical protein
VRLGPGLVLMETDEIMADEIASMEEAELEALTSLNDKQGDQNQMSPDEEMDSLLFEIEEQGPTMQARQDQQPQETPYGSDDDEYDHIFLDVIQEENKITNQSSQHANRDQDMMDMN